MQLVQFMATFYELAKAQHGCQIRWTLRREALCEDAVSFQYVTKNRKNIEFVWKLTT